jgi:hypothetical protein
MYTVVPFPTPSISANRIFRPAAGTFHYWDKDNKQRLKAFPSNSTQTFNPPKWQDGSVAPITATAFSADGSIFAYAFSYDWGKVRVTLLFFFSFLGHFFLLKKYY